MTVTGERRPLFLALATWLTIAWLLMPALLGVRIALSSSGDAFGPRGWSLDWVRSVMKDSALSSAFGHSLRLALVTVGVATPVGTALAIGLRGWRSRTSFAARGSVLLAVVLPQTMLAYALFLTFVMLTHFPLLGGGAQMLGHITLAIPFVVLIVSVRGWSIGWELDEMAADLGAAPTQAVRRVLLPLLAPAIAIAATAAFLVSYDNIVLSAWLCISNACQTVPTTLFRGPTLEAAPIDYALGTMAAGAEILVVTLAWVAARAWQGRKPTSRNRGQAVAESRSPKE